ncbi:hypothetical protein [Moorena sp. SIO3B2]|uniref:hypothetical protein n=1 Tax=Moorena sp. SIO3B2 TaxID=2607827 RepID=UPI0013CBCEDB|nr:hypothetical protein [Moorena sp. SIO3B2]NEP36173.1 hypothetical protein [Moorena sp. SIO3B2]
MSLVTNPETGGSVKPKVEIYSNSFSYEVESDPLLLPLIKGDFSDPSLFPLIKGDF